MSPPNPLNASRHSHVANASGEDWHSSHAGITEKLHEVYVAIKGYGDSDEDALVNIMQCGNNRNECLRELEVSLRTRNEKLIDLERQKLKTFNDRDGELGMLDKLCEARRAEIVTIESQRDGLQQRLTNAQDGSRALEADLSALKDRKTAADQQLAATVLKAKETDAMHEERDRILTIREHHVESQEEACRSKDLELAQQAQDLNARDAESITARNAAHSLRKTADADKVAIQSARSLLRRLVGRIGAPSNFNESLADFETMSKIIEDKFADWAATDVILASERQHAAVVQENLTIMDQRLQGMNTTRQTLIEQIKSFEGEMLRLKKRDTALETRIQEQNTEKQDLLIGQQRYEILLASWQGELAKAQVKVEKFEKGMNAAETSLVLERSKADGLSLHLQERESKLDELTTKNSTLGSDLIETRAKLSAISTESQFRLNKLRDVSLQLQGKESKLDELTTKNSTLGSDLTETRAKLSATSTESKIHLDELKDVSLQLQEKESKLDELTIKNSTLGSDLTETRAKLSATSTDSNIHLDKLKDVSLQLQEKVDELTTKTSTLDSDLAQTRAKLSTTSAESKIRLDKLKEVMRQCSLIEDNASANRVLLAEHQAWEPVLIKRLNYQNAQLVEVTQKEKEMDQNNAALSVEASLWRETYEGSLSTIKDLEKENKKLRKDLGQCGVTMTQKDKELDSARSRRSGLETELQKLKHSVEVHAREISTLKQNLQGSSNVEASLRGELDTRTLELAASTDQVTRLRNDNESLNADLVSVAPEIEASHKQVEALRQEMNHCQSLLKTAKAAADDRDQMQQRIDDIEKASRDAEASYHDGQDALKAELRQVERDKVDIRALARKFRDQRDALEVRSEELEEELDLMRSSIASNRSAQPTARKRKPHDTLIEDSVSPILSSFQLPEQPEQSFTALSPINEQMDMEGLDRQSIEHDSGAADTAAARQTEAANSGRSRAPPVLQVGSMWSIDDVLHPRSTAHPIPESILEQLRSQISGWDARNKNWRRGSFDGVRRCADSLCRKRGSRWANGDTQHACLDCVHLKRLCVAIKKDDIELLPVYKEDGTRIGPESEEHWRT